jgi:hypothetical protein
LTFGQFNFYLAADSRRWTRTLQLNAGALGCRGDALPDDAIRRKTAIASRCKQLEAYQFPQGLYLMPVDGTQYFSSGKIQWAQRVLEPVALYV